MFAQWNAIKLYNEWRLLDIHWACSSVFKNEEQKHRVVHLINEFYFLTDPDAFIGTHFPSSPKWQLLPQSIYRDTFLNLPKFGDRFFKLGISLGPSSHSKSRLTTNHGMLTVPFKISEWNSSNIKFRLVYF